MIPTIAIINRTTVVPDQDFVPVVSALQKQVSGDFAPLWGEDAKLVFVPLGTQPDPGDWQLVISDYVQMAGALGYHDFTKEGLPIGKVGVVTTKKAGGNWTITASHEVLEMLADPDIIRTAFIQMTSRLSLIFAYECCDPVEDDDLAYSIDGVAVSDFVTEQWFQPGRVGVPFSFRKHVGKPLTLAPGGYISVFRTGIGGRWQQITARKGSYAVHGGDAVFLASSNIAAAPERYSKIATVGSRRERRNRSRDEWLPSDKEESNP